jgi:hypothetical protein
VVFSSNLNLQSGEILVRERLGGGPPPREFGSQYLPLLQSVPSQTFSAGFGAAKKASFQAVLRVGLGVLDPERYASSLSERRSLSEAWRLTDFLYKLFPQHFNVTQFTSD